MNYCRFFTLLFVCLFCFSCAGNHCIKIGGGYQEVTGNFEYCFSEEKSIENGMITMVGFGKENVLLNKSDLEIILEKIETVENATKENNKANNVKKSLKERIQLLLGR